jgi:hypothetical protein
VLVALTYGRALGYGFPRSIDAKLAEAVSLVDGPSLFSGIMMDLSRLVDSDPGLSALWRPTVNLAYLFSGWLGEGDAWAFRLVSMTALVVIAASARHMVGRSRGRDLVLALTVFHPMMTAAVLDLASMPSLLMAMFAILAVSSRGRIAFLATLAAMGAHEAAAIIPFIAMGFSRNAKGEMRDHGRWRTPLLAVLSWWGLLSLLKALGVLGAQAISVPNVAGFSQAAAHVWFYLARLIIPTSPVFARTPPSFIEPWPALAWLGLLFVLWLSIRAGPSRKTPIGPGFAAGVVCVLLALLASGGLLSEVPGYGEGRLALPIVGMAWMLASRPSPRLAAWTVVPICAVVTVLRVGVWAEPINLWAESHRARPADAMVSLEYGSRLISSKPNLTVALMEQVLAADASPEQRKRAHIGAIQAWFEIGNEKRALPHLSAVADPDEKEGGWLLVRRCILETRVGFREVDYPAGTVLSPLARVCAEAATRFPRHAGLANAAGVEAAIRGDISAAQTFLERALEIAPHNGEYRRSFSLIPINVWAWGGDEPLSPDRMASP